ncbi:hypothetical protein [Enterococcus sp. DIV2324]|uniref:hypothetical protein n=1 Tax=Enterococcus sp. DIV2324 TaxID=2774763 RepID=UPI003F29CBCF
MSKLLLTEEYPRQQSIGTALSSFIDRLSVFFGGHVTVIDRKPISHTEYFYVEVLLFSNGLQIKATVQRDPETFEITATAHRESNYTYLSQFTDEEFDFLCHLAITRMAEVQPLPGLERKLEIDEQEEIDLLNGVIPKLLILTGQSAEGILSGR